VTAPTVCQCGHSGEGPHPCHGDGGMCRRPAQLRLYRTRVGRHSMEQKVDFSETWACNECWDAWCSEPE